MKLKKVLFVPDSHHPYVDKHNWNLMLKAAKEFRPDTVVVLGDFADFYAVSAHSKDPTRQNDLEWEVNEVNKAIDQLDSLKAKEKIYVAGNHENRLERYLQDKAPELFNTVRISRLLKLSERGWRYIPYKHDFRLGKLYITHDCGSAGRNALFRSADTYHHNVVIGHTHRLQFLVEGNALGETHVAASFGWLGDAKSADYMHRIKANRDWANGFGIGYMTNNGTVYLQPIPIVNGTCLVEGKLYA